MKMILNNRYFGKSLLLVSACSLWMLGACTGDFMETNTDPNAVTEEELGYDNLPPPCSQTITGSGCAALAGAQTLRYKQSSLKAPGSPPPSSRQ